MAELTGTPTGVAQMRSLMDAVVAFSGALELPELLARIVAEAIHVVDARYGAVGGVGLGWRLDQFVVAGLDGATEASSGYLPQGRDLLGHLPVQGEPLRLARIADHPAAAGFPPRHPPVTSFLGVRLRAGGETLGILYVTDKTGGREFTAADAVVLRTLAAAAAVAVGNARLQEDSRRRQLRLLALNEIRSALFSGTDTHDALQLVAQRACELTSSDTVLLLLPDPAAPADQLIVAVSDGHDAAELRGLRTPIHGSVAGEVYRTGEAVSVTGVTGEPGSALDGPGGFGSAVFAPLGEPAGTGVLVVGRLVGAPVFGPDETAFTLIFAAQAALALRMEEAQRAQNDGLRVADRERIAQDLHDQVIQRLFATGLGLESITSQVAAPALQVRLRRSVDDLDETVRDIRHAIFELHDPADRPETLRARMCAVLERAVGATPLLLVVDVADSVDAVVSPVVGHHALAVLGEAVTNVIRHAGASTLRVTVTAGDRLRIEVADDGSGFPPADRRSGLANLADRAGRLGGALTLGCSPTGGALVTWDVPLRPEPARPVRSAGRAGT